MDKSEILFLIVVVVLVASNIFSGSLGLSYEAKRVYLPRSLTGGIECPFEKDPPSTVILWSKGDHLFEHEDVDSKNSKPIFSQKKRRVTRFVEQGNSSDVDLRSTLLEPSQSRDSSEEEDFDLNGNNCANQSFLAPKASPTRRSVNDSPVARASREKKWKRRGEGVRVRVDRRGVLVIDDVSEADEGTYTCISYSNDGGRTSGDIQVFVRDLPKFMERPHANYHKLIGETVTFPCRIESQPKADILWVKKKGPFPPSTRTLLDGGDLTIAHLSREDQGLYSCFASNVAGVVVTSTRLVVRAFKDSRPQRLKVGSIGRSVEISWMPGYGILHHVLWYRIKDAYERDWQTLSLNYPNATSFTVFHLQPATNYSFMIMSRDVKGEEHFSESVVAMTGGFHFMKNYIEEYPDEKYYIEKPANLTARILPNDIVVITWIYRRTKEADENEIPNIRKHPTGSSDYASQTMQENLKQVPTHKFLIDCRRTGNSIWRRLAEVPFNVTSYNTSVEVLKRVLQESRRTQQTRKDFILMRSTTLSSWLRTSLLPSETNILSETTTPNFLKVISTPITTASFLLSGTITTKEKLFTATSQGISNVLIASIDLQVSSWSQLLKGKPFYSASTTYVLRLGLGSSQLQKRQQYGKKLQLKNGATMGNNVDNLWASGVVPTLFIMAGLFTIIMMLAYWCYARPPRERKPTQTTDSKEIKNAGKQMNN